MSKSRVCAYCGEEGVLTKEHVFPDCFQKTFEPITPTKTPAGEKAILSALEIQDVCARCNNERLSPLDTYFCDLNDLYFSNIVRPGDRIQFQFDWNLLLRTFLKIAYNVARARKEPTVTWQGITEYIVTGGQCPVDFHIFLQLMIPTPATKANRPLSPGTTEVPPWPMSVYQIDVSRFPGLSSGFWISVWSYRFFVLREDPDTLASTRRRTLAKCSKNTPGAYELTTRGIATVYASSVDVLAAVENSRVFDEQLAKARKLKAATDRRRRQNH
jgi:hypothetical protein